MDSDPLGVKKRFVGCSGGRIGYSGLMELMPIKVHFGTLFLCFRAQKSSLVSQVNTAKVNEYLKSQQYESLKVPSRPSFVPSCCSS